MITDGYADKPQSDFWLHTDFDEGYYPEPPAPFVVVNGVACPVGRGGRTVFAHLMAGGAVRYDARTFIQYTDYTPSHWSEPSGHYVLVSIQNGQWQVTSYNPYAFDNNHLTSKNYPMNDGRAFYELCGWGYGWDFGNCELINL